MKSGPGSYPQFVVSPSLSATRALLLMYFKVFGRGRMNSGKERISEQSCMQLLIRALPSYNYIENNLPRYPGYEPTRFNNAFSTVVHGVIFSNNHAFFLSSLNLGYGLRQCDEPSEYPLR